MQQFRSKQIKKEIPSYIFMMIFPALLSIYVSRYLRTSYPVTPLGGWDGTEPAKERRFGPGMIMMMMMRIISTRRMIYWKPDDANDLDWCYCRVRPQIGRQTEHLLQEYEALFNSVILQNSTVFSNCLPSQPVKSVIKGIKNERKLPPEQNKESKALYSLLGRSKRTATRGGR